MNQAGAETAALISMVALIGFLVYVLKTLVAILKDYDMHRRRMDRSKGNDEF